LQHDQRLPRVDRVAWRNEHFDDKSRHRRPQLPPTVRRAAPTSHLCESRVRFVLHLCVIDLAFERQRDAELALAAAGRAVPDWAGGTRLGDNLKAFLDRWGQRGMARGAVVVLFSDGWERGDPTQLATQMARLQRMAHRVVWVNPHRGKAGYEPVQSGVVAALPHVDDFLAGHSLATFSDLVEVVARA